MNQFEANVSHQLDGIEALLEQTALLEQKMRQRPQDSKALLADWSGRHQPEFEEHCRAATPWLNGTWQRPDRGPSEPIQAWSSAAVRGEQNFVFVPDHSHQIGPLFGERQRQRAARLKKEWDVRLQELYQLARKLTSAPPPAEYHHFWQRCLDHVEKLRTSSWMLSELRKELGLLPLSWEHKQELRTRLDELAVHD